MIEDALLRALPLPDRLDRGLRLCPPGASPR